MELQSAPAASMDVPTIHHSNIIHAPPPIIINGSCHLQLPLGALWEPTSDLHVDGSSVTPLHG